MSDPVMHLFILIASSSNLEHIIRGQDSVQTEIALDGLVALHAESGPQPVIFLLLLALSEVARIFINKPKVVRLLIFEGQGHRKVFLCLFLKLFVHHIIQGLLPC